MIGDFFGGECVYVIVSGLLFVVMLVEWVVVIVYGVFVCYLVVGGVFY